MLDFEIAEFFYSAFDDVNSRGSATTLTVVWNPGGEVAVLRHPPCEDEDGRKDLRCSALACTAPIHAMTPTERQVEVLRIALLMIMRDGCNPSDVHRAMLEVEEYREVFQATPQIQEAYKQQLDEN